MTTLKNLFVLIFLILLLEVDYFFKDDQNLTLKLTNSAID